MKKPDEEPPGPKTRGPCFRSPSSARPDGCRGPGPLRRSRGELLPYACARPGVQGESGGGGRESLLATPEGQPATPERHRPTLPPGQPQPHGPGRGAPLWHQRHLRLLQLGLRLLRLGLRLLRLGLRLGLRLPAGSHRPQLLRLRL
jgi:hypothetical protein